MKQRGSYLAAAAFTLQGCATLVHDDWQPQPVHPALAPYHIEISETDLARVCGKPGLRVYGCAMRVVDARVCFIYTPPQPPAWLMAHEHKHCAGWDHGPHPERTETRVAAASG